VASGGGRRQLRDSLKYSGLGTLGPSLQAPERPQERTDAVGESVDWHSAEQPCSCDHEELVVWDAPGQSSWTGRRHEQSNKGRATTMMEN